MIKGERGAAATFVICLLPMFVVVAALVLDIGVVLWYRFTLVDVADLAALAGVQELDLEALANGEPRLLSDVAKAATVDYARSNIQARLGPAAVQALKVKVNVYNGSDHDPLVHPSTGRELLHPTVCLHLWLPVRLALTSHLIGYQELLVSAHADAAAVWRSQ